MRIIITGALGHIGSSLIRSLPFAFPDLEIVLIDNMMTQRYPSLFNLPNIGNYKFIEADITNCDLIPILENSNYVIHLAAITDAAGSFDKRKIFTNFSKGKRLESSNLQIWDNLWNIDWNEIPHCSK